MKAGLRTERGMALLDCLAYLSLFALILGMAFVVFYRATENFQNLSRDAAGIVRALRAGEQWRQDVRLATNPPRLETKDGEAVLHLTLPGGEGRYAFRDGTVFRQALPNTNWIAVLPAVKSSLMQRQPRQYVTAWRWEVELQGRQKVARVRPMFTFQAVPAAGQKP